MRWMLDTNVCIDAIRRRSPSLLSQFNKAGMENLCISTVVLSELYYGAARYPQQPQFKLDVDQFVERIKVLNWDRPAAQDYGVLRAELEKKGRTSGTLDLMIAAHARSLDVILVTNNTKHFISVPRLRLEDWA